MKKDSVQTLGSICNIVKKETLIDYGFLTDEEYLELGLEESDDFLKN